jgi:hypothetical protein
MPKVKKITLTAGQWIGCLATLRQFRGIEVFELNKEIKKSIGNPKEKEDPTETMLAELSDTSANALLSAIGQLAFSEDVEALMDAVSSQL